ncbi:MAG: carbohydrate-binding module family 20 domain-containing protein, partial [Leptolyngbyaceae cyanobacterium]
LNYIGNSDRPIYHHRTTQIQQQQTDNTVTVEVSPAVDVNGSGPFSGAVTSREVVVELITNNAEAATVMLNGSALSQYQSQADYEAASSGWFNAGNGAILAKSDEVNAYDAAQRFSFELQPIAPKTSVNFVCDQGFTVPGQSVYVFGSIAELGEWDASRAVRLQPSVYYEYIYNPPTGASDRPGPSAPIWTGIVEDLPPSTTFEWKCLIRNEDDAEVIRFQPGANVSHTTGVSGYAGQSNGSL